jgi:hypothetical protein
MRCLAVTIFATLAGCAHAPVGTTSRDAGSRVDESTRPVLAAGPTSINPKYITSPTVDAQSYVGFRDGSVGWFAGPASTSPTISGDCLSSAVDGGSKLDCVAVTGTDGGIYPVHPAEVANTLQDAGNGVITVERATSISGSASTTMTYPIPPNTSGTVTVIVSAHSTGDSGTNGGSATWSCGVVNYGGTCKVYTACAASTSWGSTDGGAGWSTSLAITSCVATQTVTGSTSSGTVDWAATFQYQNAH